MRFFIEVKLLFEYLLHFGFGLVPGFRFFLSNAVYWNIFPSTLVLQPDIQSFQCNNIRGNRTSFQSLLRLHVVGMSMVSSP